jgi:hypothetical protein
VKAGVPKNEEASETGKLSVASLNQGVVGCQNLFLLGFVFLGEY